MKVSVIIPTWNCEAYILRALTSIANNSYDDYEVFVMDNLSSDGTARLVEGLKDPRITLISQKDNGLYDAIDRGIKAATGEITYWLGADDQMQPGSMQKAVAAFADAKVSWVVGGGTFLYEGKGEDRTLPHALPETVDLRQILKGNCLISPSVFFRKAFYEEVGGFDMRYRLAADYGLWIKFASKQPPAIIRDSLSIFSYNGGNASSKSKVKMYQETLDIIAKVNQPGTALPKAINTARLHAYISYNRLKRLVAKK